MVKGRTRSPCWLPRSVAGFSGHGFSAEHPNIRQLPRFHDVPDHGQPNLCAHVHHDLLSLVHSSLPNYRRRRDYGRWQPHTSVSIQSLVQLQNPQNGPVLDCSSRLLAPALHSQPHVALSHSPLRLESGHCDKNLLRRNQKS